MGREQIREVLALEQLSRKLGKEAMAQQEARRFREAIAGYEAAAQAGMRVLALLEEAGQAPADSFIINLIGLWLRACDLAAARGVARRWRERLGPRAQGQLKDIFRGVVI